jgi:hypothetical protein
MRVLKAPPPPPITNRNTNLSCNKHVPLYVSCDPHTVASHLRILITVSTDDYCYRYDVCLVSKSVPTICMWRDHTTNPSRPIDIMAKIIPRFLNVSLLPVSWQMTSEIILNPGKIIMYNSVCAKN